MAYFFLTTLNCGKLTTKMRKAVDNTGIEFIRVFSYIRGMETRSILKSEIKWPSVGEIKEALKPLNERNKAVRDSYIHPSESKWKAGKT